MKFEWDEEKARLNKIKHGIEFSRVDEFDFDTALYGLDNAMNYGEDRQTAIGLIGVGVYYLVFTERADRIRVISLRKAEPHERKEFYGR